mmetsp:Transcript_31916/g.48234  ORF Transcript_31916/g.48234 Transcript_31916/m.48234 type:complete len:170 (+) Transcript_31916:2060-2569(+)
MIPDDCSMSPHVQLPEQSDSSSDESSPPICNQACSESQISFDDQSRDCIKTDQDNYARAGAKLKNVISMALSLFWEHIGVDANENINHECNDKPATQQRIESSDNVLQLARKKTAECITLEKVRVVVVLKLVLNIIIILLVTTESERSRSLCNSYDCSKHLPSPLSDCV